MPLWADQLLPQLSVQQFDSCLHNVDTFNIFMKEFGSNNFDNILDNISLIWLLYIYAYIVPSWADQLLPELLFGQFDTLLSPCQHIVHMHEGVKFKKYFDKMRALGT